MRISSKVLGLVLTTSLIACAPKPAPVVAPPNPQQIHKATSDRCAKTLPPGASKDELANCMASQGDVISQVMLANDYLTKNRTTDRCKKGVWWLEKAAGQRDKNALAQLAEV